MAALYLHHALFSSDNQRPPSLHTLPSSSDIQNRSSLSSTTFQATASQTAEHLFPSARPLSGSSFSAPVVHHPRRESLQADVNTSDFRPQLHNSPKYKRRHFLEKAIVQRTNMIQLWKWIIFGIICTWTLYNAIRYFLSFSNFVTQERQLFALLLGSSATLALALIIASLLLKLILPTTDSLTWTVYLIKRIILPYSASFFALAPAMINFVLVFVWRRSSGVTELTLEGRCGWDVDVVWSGNGMECATSGQSQVVWGTWVAGATFRLLITLGFLAAYHALCYKHEENGSFSKQCLHFFCQTRNHRDPSFVDINTRTADSQRNTVLSSTLDPSQPVNRHEDHHTGAEDDATNGAISRKYLNPRMPQGRDGIPTITSGEFSGSSALQSWASDNTTISPEISSGVRPTSIHGSNNPDAQSFAERFHSAIDQFAKEIKDGMNLTSNRSMPDDDFVDSPNSCDVDYGVQIYDPSTQPPPGVSGDGDSYDESRNPPMQSDALVQVFGRLVHRMPTIESLGSREAHSLVLSMSTHHLERDMISAASSPSIWTRTNTVSDNDASSPVSMRSVNRGINEGRDQRVTSLLAFRMASEIGELSNPTNQSNPGSSGDTPTPSTSDHTFYSFADSPSEGNGVDVNS